MAVDITIGSLLFPSAQEYTVSEDSSPVNVDDSSGAIGDITFSFDGDAEDFDLDQKAFTLKDGDLGTTHGVVRTISVNDAVVTASAVPTVSAMTVRRQAKPFRGTLAGAIRYYLSLVGLTDKIVVDPTFEQRQVAFAGWDDEVYIRVAKMLCSAQQIEMAFVSDSIVFRKLRERTVEDYRDSALTVSLDRGAIAQRVKVNYYESTYRENAPVYPPGGWTPDLEVFTVESGETAEFDDIAIEASLISVQQPVCVQITDQFYDKTSIYTVVGKDGNVITPAMWKQYGGDLRVEINPDTRSLRVIVVGMRFPEYAPYSIALASSETDMYSTLRIVGTGIFLAKKEMEYDTGYGPDEASTEIVGDAENEFLTTKAAADLQMQSLLTKYGSPTKLLQVTTTSSTKAGKKLTFGTIAGSRRRYRNSMYRIRGTRVSVGSINYTAEADTTVRDINAAMSGLTVGQLNAMNRGKTIKDINREPLARNDL